MFNEILYNDALYNDISIETLYVEYTRGSYNSLPTDDANLATRYTPQDYIKVSEIDGIYVDQTGEYQYMIHEFKDTIQVANTCTVTWVGKTNLPPSISPIILEIYNRDTELWDQLDSDNSSPSYSNLTLTSEINDLTDYKDTNNYICCRVYQLAV
jgi:hypothetical protein